MLSLCATSSAHNSAKWKTRTNRNKLNLTAIARMIWQLTWLSPLLFCLCCHGYNWSELNLPVRHIPYYFNNNPYIKDLCKEDDDCPYKMTLKKKRCWGYEKKCPVENRMSVPECPGDSRGWANTKEDQIDQFWKGADFGYVQERRNEMKAFCVPKSQDDSSLECSKYARYCYAKNIYLDFRHATFTANENFQEDFLLDGEIGGHCELNKRLLKAEGEHKSPLQSWFAEVEHYSSLPFKPINNENCDIIIDKPVMFTKLDAGVNMFHHYCDFINYYTSQHVNNSFSTDIYVINWDTSQRNYFDLFKETFEAFTQHKMKYIRDFDDKRVCIKEAMFPLLPRMRWGMFYNMPLIPGCHGSSLFQAFSAHLVHRLHIPQEGPLLLAALKTVGEYEARLVVYSPKEMPFLEQVKISHNSDVFIGMHGAGLTHMLYQPDWASVIELFHCGDPNCYLDLARLRGLKYFTWEKMEKLVQEDEGHHPQLGAHQKFTNYEFDEVEFMKLVAKATDHVRSHPDFIQARKSKYNTIKDEL
ncbi:EGF domain-specific O-linked N-acetylglucosamine transferase-like isoform X2 [Ruditapes philippinarum]|uniref:EGF domain-specific O-linked N-acetylglucosamine transferase-like isoform X2 n=1 Tax=Ruditapes philippinarum TaxID=129788 RepID=UPI00295A893F|nr:EGF domain-specific O-linked N-acetylglucosamine transferase-like isoform X2 [Ruditapes philippinarum]